MSYEPVTGSPTEPVVEDDLEAPIESNHTDNGLEVGTDLSGVNTSSCLNGGMWINISKSSSRDDDSALGSAFMFDAHFYCARKPADSEVTPPRRCGRVSTTTSKKTGGPITRTT